MTDRSSYMPDRIGWAILVALMSCLSLTPACSQDFSNHPIKIIAPYVAGYNSDTWYGFAMPRGVPEPIAEILHRAIIRALESNRNRLAQDGFFIDGGSRQERALTIRADLAKWTQVVKQAGISMQ